MSKENVEDLLGGDTPAKKKPAAKKVATKAPAKKVATKAPAKKAEPVATEKRVKEPVTWDEGEKEALMKRIKSMVRKDINSKELATKLDIPTRKLRVALYSMSRAGTIALELGGSKVLGMTVSPAA
jgi:hypothetical protein